MTRSLVTRSLVTRSLVTRSLVTKAAVGCRAIQRAVTRVKPEPASKSQVVDADLSSVEGRLHGMGKQSTCAPVLVRRGKGHGTLERHFGQSRETRSTGGNSNIAAEWWGERESEKVVVPFMRSMTSS